MKTPFLKNISEIPLEVAHEGMGARQVLLSWKDIISSQLEVVTKGFLKYGHVFDWHNHIWVDEIWIVLQWEWIIEYENGTIFHYKKDDLIYNPENLKHKITATGKQKSIYYFIRLKV
jgi:mannose-6-phosphate isomerase-like protein (cupin superfamily)